jgi:hypothetical protein
MTPLLRCFCKQQQLILPMMQCCCHMVVTANLCHMSDLSMVMELRCPETKPIGVVCA